MRRRHPADAACCLCFMVLAPLIFSANSHAGVVFQDKFDSRSFSGWTPSGNNTAKITNSPIRSGNYAATLSLHRTKDKVPYRTELRVKGNLKIGKQYTIEFSQYLPDSWKPDSIGEIIFQLHAVPDSREEEHRGSPVLGLFTQNGNWKLVSAWDPNRITKNSIRNKTYNLGSHAKGRWTDWVVQITLSYGQDGKLEVWRDGKKVVSQRGPNTFNDQIGPFIKTGIYKPAWNDRNTWGSKSTVDSRTLHIDKVRVIQ